MSLPDSSHSSVLAGVSTSLTPLWMLGIVGMEHCSSDCSSPELWPGLSVSLCKTGGLGGTTRVTELNLPYRHDTSRAEGVAG